MESFTKSYQKAEKFKYDIDAKKKLFEKVIKYQLKIPVVVYTKNKNIPDLTQTIFLISKWIEVDKMLEMLREKLSEPINQPLCIMTEYDEDGCIVEDILIEELYEYERNKDGILYLVLDVKN